MLGTVYTDAVSFVTASVSMRLGLSLHGGGRVLYQNRVVLNTLSKVERFQNDTVSSCKRRNRIALIKNGLARNWLAREVNMVNLARSAALCCTITTLICGLSSLLLFSCSLL